MDELALSGVRDVCIAPGSRSTPLVLAVAGDARLRVRVHMDERSAGFFALGVGKATRVPAAVVTTSGTAAANLFPAVVEAERSETPLLVLTADRLHRLRDADANQTIDQLRLFGPNVRAFFEVAPASAEAAALRHLRGLAGRAVAAAIGQPAGPVHVNFPFDKPLEPAVQTTREAGSEARGASEVEDPIVRVSPRRPRASEQELRGLVTLCESAEEGILVAGPSAEPDAVGEAVLRLGAATGYPVLADPLSGARFRPPHGAAVTGAHDLFLRDAKVRELLRPQLVLRVGSSPTSASVQRFLLETAPERHVVIDGGGRWKDHGGTVTDYVQADAADTLERLEALARRSASGHWRGRWLRADEVAREAAPAAAEEFHEGDVLATVAASVPEGGTIFVSSSMPVRDLDAFGVPRAEHVVVHGNRGASGIDGIVSTAFGVASAAEGPTVCVLGDVALFHDQNGLLWSREPDLAVVFVLIDNDGGGIFHMLPVREHEPEFTKLFAAPHGLDFAHAAALHGVAFEDVATPGHLARRLTECLGEPATRVLRVRTDREANRRRHEAVAAAVARSVRDALG